jgi:hypothetical protein
MTASQFDDDNIKNAFIDTVAASMNISANNIINFRASRRRMLVDRNLQSSVQLDYAVQVIAEAIAAGQDPSAIYAQLSSSLSEAMSDPIAFSLALSAALPGVTWGTVLPPTVSQPTISIGGFTKSPTPSPSFAPTTLMSTSLFKNAVGGGAAAFVVFCLIVLAYVNKKKLPFVTFTSSKGAFNDKKGGKSSKGAAPTLLTLDDLLGEENTTRKIVQSNKQASTRTRSNSPPRNKLSSLGQPKHSQFTTITYEPTQNVDLTAESRRAAQDILTSWGVDDESRYRK